MMKRHRIIFVILGAFFLLGEVCAGYLLKNGQSDYTLYVAEDATAAEKNASEEFRKYWKLATGSDLQTSKTFTGKKQILIGNSSAAAKLLQGIDLAGLKNDEIIIAPSGENLILCGDRPRGTLFAVYEFMKREMGIRFWTAKEETVPRLTNLSLPNQMYRYAPPPAIRHPYFASLLQNPDFAAKMHCYGVNYSSSAKWGGTFEPLIGPWHTFDRFFPAEQYLKTHPEYFSLHEGKRVGGQFKGQLCLSNPELRKKFLEIVRSKLRKNPEARVISVTQNDNNNYCKCPDCKKIDDEGGAPSASVLTFVNYIAENIEKEFPDVMVQTFAYQYSRQLPKGIVPRKNVSIFLCAIEADFSKELQTPGNEENSAFMRDLNAWRKIGANLAVWYYVSNFNDLLLPHPNLDALKKDVVFLAKLNPSMVMLECDAVNANPIGDLMPLKVWLCANLLWDPSADPEKLQDEFVEGYYGEAAPFVKQYLRLRKNDALKNPVFVGCFEYTAKWISPNLLFQCLGLLDQAELAAKDPVIRERISILKKPLEYYLITEYSNSLRNHPECPDYKTCVKIAKEYLEFLKKQNVTHGTGFTDISGARGKIERFVQYPPANLKKHPFFRKFRGRRILIFEEDAFVIHGTKHAEIVRDELARNSWAIQLKHIGVSWEAQLPIRPELKIGKSYEIYAACRLEKPAKGGFLHFGGYDSRESELYIDVHPDANNLKTDCYVYVPLGMHKIRRDGYMFTDNKINPEIKFSYLDHLVFIEQ